MDSVLVTLAFRSVTVIDWSSSGDFNAFAFYNLSTGTMKGYSAERIAQVKRQKVGDRPVTPVMAPAVNVNWFYGLMRKTNSEVVCHYRWYRCITDDDAGQSADIPALMKVLGKRRFGRRWRVIYYSRRTFRY